MKLETEHIVISVLAIVLAYYVYTHLSLLSDLSQVQDDNHPHLKAVKDKHCLWFCDTPTPGPGTRGGLCGTYDDCAGCRANAEGGHCWCKHYDKNTYTNYSDQAMRGTEKIGYCGVNSNGVLG